MKLLLLGLLAFLPACHSDLGTPGEKEEINEPIVVSSIKHTPEGKAYLDVAGKPMALYGAQIRVDIFRSVDQMDWDTIELYFRTAKDLGLNCVQVSYPWKFLEPREDEYCFDEIDRILTFANEYGLKIELLWFSTNMIGDSYTYLVPTYILAKPELRLAREGDGAFHPLYGYTYSIVMDDEWLLSREVKAVTRLFNHIRTWDKAHGDSHPVITCQVHNEPDALIRWRLAEKKICDKSGSLMETSRAWQMTLKALDTVGKAIKNSSYRVATRTNIISGNGVSAFPQTPNASPKDVYALEGIDFVSFDPYMTTVNQIASEVSAYASMKGNYPLIAENRGDFSNTASLMLAASALGGGYDIYDLATSPYITSHSAPPFNTEGIYNSDLTPKPQVAEVKKLLAGLIQANEDVALTALENFAVFNITTDSPELNRSQQIRTTGAILDFNTKEGALAFVLDRGDRLIACSTAAATLTISGGSSSGPINLRPGECFTIPFVSDGPIQSTTKKNIGTLYK